MDIFAKYALVAGRHAKVVQAGTDPFAVRRGETFLLAQMQFDSAGDLDAALRSEARRRARDDFHRFPPFDGDVTHEAMSSKVAF